MVKEGFVNSRPSTTEIALNSKRMTSSRGVLVLERLVGPVLLAH